MKRHLQTVLADPERGDGHDANGVPGDCFRTAIACLIDADEVAEVPHFVASGEHWWDETQEFMSARGDGLYYLPLPIPEDWGLWWDEYRQQAEYVLLDGPSPRGDFYHVVIGTPDLEFVHDPHPSQAGLVSVAGFFVHVPEGGVA